MKNHVIKALVVILGISVYFNVSNILEVKTLNHNQTLLQETIDGLEQKLEDLEEQIENQEDIEIDTCSKLYEVTIQVISEDDDFDTSYTHCTNKVLLGDALDEVSEELQIEFSARHDQYGRMVNSFYGIDKVYEEYFAIYVNGVYSPVGLDFVEIKDGGSYEFTLTRWG